MNNTDYDPGLLNDFGGGNVQWWQDYIRAEIGSCNEYWQEICERDEVLHDKLVKALADYETALGRLRILGYGVLTRHGLEDWLKKQGWEDLLNMNYKEPGIRFEACNRVVAGIKAARALLGKLKEE